MLGMPRQRAVAAAPEAAPEAVDTLPTGASLDGVESKILSPVVVPWLGLGRSPSVRRQKKLTPWRQEY